MARNETFVAAPPEAVWSVLCDPYAYPRWVVGTDRTLEADPAFPQPQTKFKVRFPLGLQDYTHSRVVEENKRIVLDAGGGPWGAARVDIRLEAVDGGTKVTLIEEPTWIFRPLNAFPPLHWFTRLRNTEALKRFRRIVERRHASTSSE